LQHGEIIREKMYAAGLGLMIATNAPGGFSSAAIRREKVHLQFRVEAFNLFTRAWLDHLAGAKITERRSSESTIESAVSAAACPVAVPVKLGESDT
ncbi:MAG: hypothetical protein WA634_02565, partial [Silvibacterium sp.]